MFSASGPGLDLCENEFLSLRSEGCGRPERKAFCAAPGEFAPDKMLVRLKLKCKLE
jgi:hypothetical protein